MNVYRETVRKMVENNKGNLEELQCLRWDIDHDWFDGTISYHENKISTNIVEKAIAKLLNIDYKKYYGKGV